MRVPGLRQAESIVEESAVNTPVDSAPPSDQVIYAENIGPIYAFIYSKVGHREIAQDLTAEVFVKALALVDHTQSHVAIRAWLYRVARTTVADYWRATLHTRIIPLIEAHEHLREPDEVSVEPPPSQHDVTRQALALLDRLPAHYRRVLALRCLHGYSLRETANTLGLTERNVKVLQHRAIRTARDLQLEDAYDGAR